MKIYTKTGDDGTTGLFGGARVRKNHPRIEACGAIDELNAVLGVVATLAPDPHALQIVHKAQTDLFSLGAELATPSDRAERLAQLSTGVTQADIADLEAAIDHCESALSPLKQFILPGGSAAAAALHHARAVCRRAERRVLAVDELEPLRSQVPVYLNRLGDLLFVLARLQNQQLGVADEPWHPPKG